MKNKSLVIAFMLLAFLSIESLAQDQIYQYSISQMFNDQFYEGVQQKIEFDQKTEKLYIGVDVTTNYRWFTIEKQQRGELLAILDKIVKWDSTANSIKATIEKEVGVFNCSGGFKVGNEFNFDNSIKIEFTFTGEEDDGVYKTFTIANIPAMKSGSNPYIRCESHGILIYTKDIKELKHGITGAIDEFLKVENDKKNEIKKFDSYFK